MKRARADVVGSLLRPPYLRDAPCATSRATCASTSWRTSWPTVVLGLLTTKQGALEDATAIEGRIREATRQVPLERPALSPQCGFASGEAGNPLTAREQEAKLRRVGEVARKVWGA